MWPDRPAVFVVPKSLTVYSLIACSILLGLAAAGESDPALTPATDERELSSTEAERVLGLVAENFKAHPHVRAHMRTEIDDLLGQRIEEGELCLSRPDHIRRTFNQPALKVWLLNGPQLQEYSARSKMVRTKDFSKMPDALALLQAALTLDLKVLAAHFAIHMFENTGQTGHLRLVLTKKPGGSRWLAYKRIQVRLALDSPLYSEIEYVPENGDRTLERYTGIQTLPAMNEQDFVLDLPAGVERKVDVLEPQ